MPRVATWTGTVTDAMRAEHGGNLPAIVAVAAKTALRHQYELLSEPTLVTPASINQVVHAEGDVEVRYQADVA
jgi:hypothetical protein